MKSFFLFACLSMILLSNCTGPAPSISDTQPRISSFSKDYQAPTFANNDRMERIHALKADFQTLFEEHAKERKIPGIAYGIVIDDSLVVAGSAGFINREKEIAASTTSVFRIASMTKSFTAMAILQLQEAGKLSLEDPAARYLPEMRELEYLTSDAPIITIRNLLTMTAGFPEDNPWGDRQLNESDEMLRNMIAGGVSFSNVSSFQYEYSNLGFALLGAIVSTVSGQPYQHYIREHILEPLGMQHTYWEYTEIPEEQFAVGYRWEDEQWKLEPVLGDGSFGAMGGLITTIEDFSKYVRFHLSA